jgi:small subunit ribosomal protein S18
MSDIINNEEVTPLADAAAPEAALEAPAAPAAAAPYERKPYDRGSRPQGQGGDRGNSRFKRKVCRFCTDETIHIDYKSADILERFITDRGKILPRRVTGTCAKHQRYVAVEIKKARMIALLPFLEQ